MGPRRCLSNTLPAEVAHLTRQDIRRAREDIGYFCELVGYKREPWQLAAMRLEKKFTVWVAPRQVGKTEGLSLLALHRAFKESRHKVLVVSAGEDASGRIIQRVREIAQHPLLAGSVADETLRRVVLRNGSVIRSVPASEKQIRGEALALDTPIFTPEGWSTMGELSVGDKVYGADGQPTEVILTSPVFLGNRCYEVTFSDGSVIKADAGHLWKVYDRCQSKRENCGSAEGRDWGNHLRWHVARDKSKPTCRWCQGEEYVKPPRGEVGGWHVLTTEQLASTSIDRPTGSGSFRYRVFCDTIIAGKYQNLPIDPYVLGYWLGDGDSTRARIAVGEEDREALLSQIEQAGYIVVKQRHLLVDSVNKYGRRIKGTAWTVGFSTPEVITTQWGYPAPRRNQIPSILRQLGVFGNKHIPSIYFQASAKQRESLLQGLVDSDGTVTKNGRVSFVNVNKQLAYDVLQLARSLGQKAYIRERQPSGTEPRQTSYSVEWLPSGGVIPARLARKVARVKPSTSRSNWMSITSIREIPSIPTRCIMVDNRDHMYLAGSLFTPTHNTTDTLLIDEAAFVSDEILNSAAIPTTVARPDSKIILSSTPWGNEGMFARMYERGLNPEDEHVLTHRWRRQDAWWISEAVVEAMRESMSPLQFAAEYEGEFIVSGDAYFKREELLAAVCDFEMVKYPAFPLEATMGLDWGRRQDSHAIVLAGQLDDYGMNSRPIIVVPYVEISRRNYPAQIEEITEMTKLWRLEKIASETNGVGQAPTEELVMRIGARAQVVPITTTAGSKEDCYGKVAVLLGRRALVIPNHIDLLRQMGGVVAEPTRQGGLKIAAKTEATHDDLPDALSLAVSCIPTDLLPADKREVPTAVRWEQTAGGIQVPFPLRTTSVGLSWGRIWDDRLAGSPEEQEENPWLGVYGVNKKDKTLGELREMASDGVVTNPKDSPARRSLGRLLRSR